MVAKTSKELKELLLSEEGAPFFRERLPDIIDTINKPEFKPIYKVGNKVIGVSYIKEINGSRLTITDVMKLEILGFYEYGYFVKILKSFRGRGMRPYIYSLFHKKIVEEAPFNQMIKDEIKEIMGNGSFIFR